MDSPSDPVAGAASTSAVVERYQQLCQSGAMPDLAAFVASIPALDPRDLAALVHVDQRHRHAAGALLPAESYFEHFPALRSDTELALDVVYQEYVLKRDAGEAYSTDKYLSRFPGLAEQLAMQFQLDGAMGDEHSSRSMTSTRETVEHSPAYPPGTLIAGRYKLLEEIGEGGMGTVWVAQQIEPVRRRVALKLIKPGMDSRQVLSRFEAERQALAVMDHPHIAKVLDGGMTDEGRPYFVMEYVKGEPITDYCDRARLSVEERLKLFVQVCQAVQHAHQKGIIHRDLKPSNILVCPYDGQPVPKVIDFGLAKAMHQSLTEHSLYTAHGVMLGTPLYMSPEQAETNNLDIDTRSDLYSLGVILYELLTGSTPLEKQRLQDAALQEMLRLIQEEEPPKPSTRLSGSGSLPTIAAQRSLEPAQLSRAVRGDLDWIVMKALEKDRSRRYETANGLARDIERYLHDDPVEARPPSAGYRFRKFARRNKGALFTVGLVAVALVAGTAFSTWQAIRATRAERVAQDERLEADKQRAQADANYQKAKAAVDKYFTLVSESKLFDVPGLEPLRKELLEAALEFYEGAALERTGDPAVLVDVALMHLRVSLIYQSLNRYNDYIAANRRALDVIERLRRDYSDVGDHERKLAGFWKGQRWTQISMDAPDDLPGAIETCLRLEAIWKQLAERYPSEPGFQMDLAYLQATIGNGLWDVGRTKESFAYYDKGRAIVEKLINEYPEVPQYRADLAVGNESYAYFLRQAGRLDEALLIARRSVELGEGLVAEFPNVPAYRVELAKSHFGLGNLFAKTQPQQAEESYRRAMDLSEALVREFPSQPLYLETWERAGANWVSFETARGNHSQAEDVVRKMIEPLESQFREHPQDRRAREQLANFCRSVADQLARQGNFGALFEQMERRTLGLVTELANEFPADLVYVEQVGFRNRSLGGLAQAAGRLDEARQHYEKAIDAFNRLAADKNFPQRDGSLLDWRADTLSMLAQTLAAGGHGEEALAMARQSVECFEAMIKEYPANLQYRQRLAIALGVLVEQFVAIGRNDEVDATRQRAIKVWESFLAEHPQDRQAREQLAWTLSEAADKSQANPTAREQFLRQALVLHSELANETPGDTAHFEQTGHLYRHLGWLERGKGKLNEAQQNFEKGVGVFAKLAANQGIPQRDGYYRAFHAHSLIQVAIVLAESGHTQEAVEAARRSVEVYEGLVSEFPDNLENRRNMVEAVRVLAEQLGNAGKHEAAETAHQRTIKVLEALLAEYPQDRPAREQLAFALGDAAGKLQGQAERELREQFLRRALALSVELANEFPNEPGYSEQIGHLTLRLGWLAREKGDLEEARKSLQQAAGSFEKLAVDNIPQRDGFYRDHAADTLNHLSQALAADGKAKEAADAAQRSVNAYQTLTKEYPGNLQYRQRLASALGFLVERLMVTGQNKEAEATRQSVMKIWEALLAEHPTDRPDREQLALVVGDAAISLQNQSDRDLCEPFLRRALAMRVELANEFPGEPSHAEHKGHFYRRLGWFLRDTGKLEEAHKNLQQAADTFEKLAVDKIPQRDGFYRAYQIDSLLDLTHVLAAVDAKAAVGAAQRSVDACQTLTKEYPGNLQYQQRLTSSLSLLAERLAATGQNDEAEAARQSVMKIWETLLAEHPQDRPAREQLASTLGEAAVSLQQSQSDRELREQLLRRALALRVELEDATVVTDQAIIDSRLNRTQLHTRLGEWNEAIDLLEQARALTKEDDNPQRDKIAAAYVELCFAAFNQQKFDILESAARKAIEFQPDHGDAHFWLGIALTNLGKQEEAIAALRKAIELKPGDFGHYRSLSLALWRHGKLDEAINAIRKAIELQPEHGDLYVRLGSILIQQGKMEDGVAAFDKAIALNPADANILNQLAWSLATAPESQHRDPPRAVELAKKGVELAPNDGAIWNTLGVAQYRAGDWQAAIDGLQKSMGLRGGGDASDWFFLAMAHWQLDHKDEARTWYDKAVEWMEKNQPKNEELIRFNAEAEQLLGITQPSPAPKDAPQGGDAAKPKS